MLLNNQGKAVSVQKHHKLNESELKALVEVLVPDNHHCGTMFKLGTRARLKS